MATPKLEQNRRDNIDFNDLGSLKSNVASCKDMVTRACTAADKLVARDFTYSALDTANLWRNRILERLDLLIDVYDRISTLEASSATENNKQIQT